MSKIPQQKNLYLEHGTVKAVTLLLQEKGEDVTYAQIAKRIKRKSHPETLRVALEVSNRLKSKREAKTEELLAIIKQSKKAGKR